MKLFLRIAVVIATTLLTCHGKKTERQVSQMGEEEEAISRVKEQLAEDVQRAQLEEEQARAELRAVCRFVEELRREVREKVGEGVAVQESNARLEAELEGVCSERASLMAKCEELAAKMNELRDKRDTLRRSVFVKDSEIDALTREFDARKRELAEVRAGAAGKKRSSS